MFGNTPWSKHHGSLWRKENISSEPGWHCSVDLQHCQFEECEGSHGKWSHGFIILILRISWCVIQLGKYICYMYREKKFVCFKFLSCSTLGKQRGPRYVWVTLSSSLSLLLSLWLLLSVMDPPPRFPTGCQSDAVITWCNAASTLISHLLAQQTLASHPAAVAVWQCDGSTGQLEQFGKSHPAPPRDMFLQVACAFSFSQHCSLFQINI